MRVIFRPAELVLGRLTMVQKFVVLVLVLVIPFGIVVWAYTDQQSTQITNARTERDGVRAIVPLLRLEFEIAAARHTAVVTGSAAAVPAAALAAVDRTQRRYASIFHTAGQWAEVREQIVLAGSTSGHATSLAAYDGASIGLQDLLINVGDASMLSVDPDLDVSDLYDSVDVTIPRLVDASTQIVDQLGSDASNGLGSDRITLLSEVGIAVGVIDNASAALDQAFANASQWSADAGVRTLLPRRLRTLDDSVSRLDATLRDIRISPRAVAASTNAVEPVAVAAKRLASDATDALGRLLEARIGRDHAHTQKVVLLASIATLLAMYLFAAFYYFVAGAIRRMVTTLSAFASGERTEDLAEDGRDELGYVAMAINDMVRRVRRATQQLTHDASHDSLTGLHNRGAVIELLHRSLPRVSASNTLALLFVDLDGFKLVNDSYGHPAGDAVLRSVASRLLATTRSSDAVARLSGDEFLVVSHGLSEVDGAVELAERLLDSIAAPIEVDGQHGERRQAHVGASVGVAFVTGPLVDADAVIADADAAMYRAKQMGRGRVEVFDERLREEVLDHQRVRDELRRALERDEIEVYYQPIVDLGTRAIRGFEALVRWNHPERGLLGPAAFMPTAERSGLIMALGARVLREACRQLAIWQRDPELGPGTRMAINLSTRQLVDREIVSVFASAVADAGVDPSSLWLEITESALLIDADAAKEALFELRDTGVRMSLDDFGTGYSSLQHLKWFPLHAIKIDRGFVAGIGSDVGDEAIVRSVVELARTLGFEVVAEGVETERQREWLLDLGCSYAQGYLFAKPQPPAAFGSRVQAPSRAG
jgi:diguanylate cyclase (GGDEF)-like protein